MKGPGIHYNVPNVIRSYVVTGLGERMTPDQGEDPDTEEPENEAENTPQGVPETPITGVNPLDIEPKRNLPNDIIDRLHQAMREMPPIKKTGDGKTKHKDGTETTWKYLEDSVLTPEARRVLIRNGLHVIFNAERHDRGGTYTEKSGIQWEVEIHGIGLNQRPRYIAWVSEGEDYSDKGVSKAITSARKDFFRTQLMVSGGPEIETAPARDSAQHEEHPVTPEQKRDLKALVEKAEEMDYDTDILPMPESAEEADELISHLQDVTNKSFQKAADIETDDEEDE